MLKKIFKSRKKKVLFIKFFDFCLLKNKKKVLIVVKHSVDFSGNLRILVEEFINKADFQVYVYKDGTINSKTKKYLESNNVTVLEGFNFKIVFHILTSGVVIVGHTIRDAYISKKCPNRLVINVWHGVIFKNIELLMKNLTNEKKYLIENNAKVYNAVVASSNTDKIKMAEAFGLGEKNVYINGLLRYEILKKSYKLKDPLLLEEENYIQKLKKNKKIVLYAPTFRETSYDPLSELPFSDIEKVARKNNFIFCIRVHPYTKISTIYKESEYLLFINNDKCHETNLLLKYVDLLIVDYSSIWIDFLLLNKPIIMFVPDIDSYIEDERDFAYKFDDVIECNLYKDFKKVLEEIPRLLQNNNISYSVSKSVFHEYDLQVDFRKKFMETFNILYERIYGQ